MTNLLSLSVGGDPRILLIRGDLFTALFGIICLISLAFPRPVMFYFGRYFIAGKDPEKGATFDARAREPRFHRGFQIITAVWGLTYAAEFVARIILVYTIPVAAVVAIAPIMTGLATIFAIVWTFRFRSRMLQAAGLEPL